MRNENPNGQARQKVLHYLHAYLLYQERLPSRNKDAGMHPYVPKPDKPHNLPR